MSNYFEDWCEEGTPGECYYTLKVPNGGYLQLSNLDERTRDRYPTDEEPGYLLQYIENDDLEALYQVTSPSGDAFSALVNILKSLERGYATYKTGYKA